jgi:hypothetical protein
MGSNVLGIVYVNFSNLNNYRGNVLVNKYASYSSLIWTLALSPVFYFTSMMIVLRHPQSVSSSPCVEGDKSCAGRPYSWVDCYLYNAVAWTGGYVYGLCMTYFKLLKL